MNLAELEKENLQTFGEYEAILFEDRPYTNHQLAKMSHRLAHHLRRVGLKRGSKVMVIYPNSVEVIVAYAACWKMGAVVTPVIFLLPDGEIRTLLEDARPDCLVTQDLLLPKVQKAMDGLGLDPWILVGGKATEEGKVVSLDWLLQEGEAAPVYEPLHENHMAVLLYTSGTTGRPKGVMLSHANLYKTVVNARKTRERYELEQDRATALTALPLSHAYGLFLCVAGWLFGGKVVVLPWFDPEKVFQLIARHRVEGFAGVPTMFTVLLSHPGAEKYDVSSLRACLCGAAPLPLKVKKGFEEKFGVEILQGYGLSECSTVVSFTPPGTPDEKIGSVGLPIEGVEVRIVGEEGEAKGVGEVGEVAVRSPGVMLGYYRNPEATAEVLKEGWLHTGDVGYLDPDGYLYLVERKRDLIIRGGFNIFPKDVEEVLGKHPQVMECAVVGMPDEVLGEEVAAFVVPKVGEKPSEQELLDFAARFLSKNKQPKRLFIRPFLPKNPIGKVMKKELRKELEQEG